jgi:hypothetical protein
MKLTFSENLAARDQAVKVLTTLEIPTEASGASARPLLQS